MVCCMVSRAVCLQQLRLVSDNLHAGPGRRHKWVRGCHQMAALLYPVYMIQPVVKPDWHPAVSCKQTSNWFDNPFDNRVEQTATVRSTGCQTGLYNRFDNRLYTRYNRLSNGFENRLNVCIHDTLTTGCVVYTDIYPVVKPIWQPVWQRVASCKWGFAVQCSSVQGQHWIVTLGGKSLVESFLLLTVQLLPTSNLVCAFLYI